VRPTTLEPTTRSTIPAALAFGLTVSMRVALFTATVFAVSLPKRTEASGGKPSPSMTTFVPPITGPLRGSRLVTTGALGET
jgi:hypothetical protein